MQSPIRILLVDDNTYFLEAASDFLNMSKSLKVTETASNGQAALAQALQLQPDIILLDLNLGEQSGLELIPQLKQHTPDTKIIILTIMDGKSYGAASMQAGADAFVRKTEMTKILLPTIFKLMNVPV